MAPRGRQTRQRDGSTEAQHWVFERCKQVRSQELVPFGILAGGWEREMALVSAFVPPPQAELCHLGLNNSPSCCPLALCSLSRDVDITFQVLSPAGCQNTLCPAPPLLQVRLEDFALPGGLAAPPPPWLPPASPCRVHCLSALPSSVGLLSTLGSGESILLVFWWFSGLFRPMCVESK